MTYRLLCTFVPQFWRGDTAYAAEGVGGEHEWEADYEALPEPGTYGSDELRHHDDAPEWVRDWQGPFEVLFELVGPLATLEAERTKLQAQFEAAGGRGIELADAIDALTKKIDRLKPDGILGCPHCASGELGQVDTYLGTAEGGYRREGGVVVFDPSGSTEIHWDTAKRADEPVSCRSCGWSGQERELLLGSEDEPEETEPFDCEDCAVNGERCLTHGTAITAALDAARNQPEATLAALRVAGLAPVETE